MNDLQGQLTTGMSKETARALAHVAIQDADLLTRLIETACTASSPQDQKAAWVLWAISERKAEVLSPFATQILEVIPTKSKSGARRDLFKAVTQLKDLDEDQEGLALDIAFKNLENTQSAIAEKHSGIAFIKTRLKKYPELTTEFMALLHVQKELGTDPFKHYVNTTIAKLEKPKAKKSPFVKGPL